LKINHIKYTLQQNYISGKDYSRYNKYCLPHQNKPSNRRTA